MNGGDRRHLRGQTASGRALGGDRSARARGSAGGLWRLRRELAGGQLQGRVCGDGDLVVLAHPQFETGQVVTFFGHEAEVMSDDGPPSA